MDIVGIPPAIAVLAVNLVHALYLAEETRRQMVPVVQEMVARLAKAGHKENAALRADIVATQMGIVEQVVSPDPVLALQETQEVSTKRLMGHAALLMAGLCVDLGPKEAVAPQAAFVETLQLIVEMDANRGLAIVDLELSSSVATFGQTTPLWSDAILLAR